MKPESSGIGQRLKVQLALLLLMKNTRSVGQCQVSGPALLNAPLQSTRLTRIKKELLCQDANNKRLWACQSRLSFQAAHHRHKESSISCYVQQIPSGWFFFSTCVKVCVCRDLIQTRAVFVVCIFTRVVLKSLQPVFGVAGGLGELCFSSAAQNRFSHQTVTPVVYRSLLCHFMAH